MKILVINCGSSSIKYKFYEMPSGKIISEGIIEHIGEKGSSYPNHYTGLEKILSRLKGVDGIGHRVVHGGEELQKPVLITKSVIQIIKKYSELAPLHNPVNLEGILACKKLLPKIRQVAVLDTAFHSTIPEYAYLYALPYKYYKKYKIRKYGFHGTSHQYVTQKSAKILGKPLKRLKLITCHLGNGCSITAVDKGKSIDTSMGFTPLEGLVMGTRSGDIDPALVTYIMEKENITGSEIDSVLNQKSGLKGISGISNDMREILLMAGKGNPRAKLAIDIFVYRIRKYIGAYLSIMNGCDAVIFTGGIGENQKIIRKRICQEIFDFMKQKPKILVVPTDEELMIALQSHQLLKRKKLARPEGLEPPTI